MAQLPIYQSQKNITSEVGDTVKPLDVYSEGAEGLRQGGNALFTLAEEWQKSKDEVENLDGINKLNSGIMSILDEASNYNEYNTFEELTNKKTELSQRMQELTPNIVNGFSNNRNADKFSKMAQFKTLQNSYKLDEIFRSKYGDVYSANLEISADTALKNFTKTGNEAFKQDYFNAIDTGVRAGYVTREAAAKLKLKTDDWNYDFVYSKILENPYFKADPNIMEKIEPVKQRTLLNFQRAEIKHAELEAEKNALSNLIMNPNASNLKSIYKTSSKAKNNPKYKEIAEAQPNYETISNLSGYADALNAIKELADIDTGSYRGKQTFLAKSGDVAFQILKSNMAKDGTATLNDKEKNKLMQMLYETMNNETFKEQMKSLPNLNGLKASEIAGTDPNNIKAKNDYEEFEATRFRKSLTEWAKIDDIGKRTCEQVLNSFVKGDLQGGLQAYDNGLKAAIRQKYWYIKELQDPNLKAGKQFVLNGKVYTFQGFTQKDIIVESK